MSKLSELLPTGGGQNSVEFVASGTVASGKPVILNANGTVTQVAQSAISAAVGTAANTVLVSDIAVAYDSTNNKVLLAYRDNNTGKGMAQVGTINGTSISYGTAAEFAGSIAGDSYRRIGICFNSTEGKFVIVYRDSSINNSGRAIAATISGTSVSFGSSAVFTSDVTNSQACSFDSASNKVVIVYANDSDGNDGYGVVATLSGTSLSFGTPVEFNQYNTSFPVPIYDSNANKTVIVYRDQGASNLYNGIARVATVSGTSISYGSAATFNAASTEMQSGSFDSVNNKIVVCYTNNGNSGYGTAIVGTVSGTSISFGTAAVFQSSATGLTQFMPAYNVAAGKTVIGYGAYNGSAWLSAYVEATVSGTSLSFNTPAPFAGSNKIDRTPAFAAYDSSGKQVVFAYREAAASSELGTAVVVRSAYTTTNLTATNFIGITAGAISNAATGDVNVYGGINEAQSGLTIASDYYVQADGSLAAGATSIPFDISGATYASQSFNALSVVGGNVCDVAFKPDGLKMFLCAGTGIIYEYALSIAFDVSSASYSNTNGNISAQTPALTGISFSASGAKMYAIGTTNDTIYEFNLSTPWSVVSGSLSYSSNSFSIASKETGPTGVTLNPLGTKVYIIGYSSDSVHEFALSTAFDISSASFTSSFSVASQETSPQALQFNSDGTLMFICGGNSDKVHAYDLSSAYDISSSVYNSAFLSTASEMVTPMGFAFDPTGTKLTVFGNNSIVYGYATTQTAFVTTVKAGQAISATTINMKDLT